MKAKTKTKTTTKAEIIAKASAPTTSKKKSATSQILVDRHGNDCGYIIYSFYFKPSVILSLNDESPRNITLVTWKRWAKQAAAYEKEMKKLISRFSAKKTKTKSRK